MTTTLSRPATRTPQATAVLFGLAAICFVVYPVLRPWGDADPAGMPAAFASPAWLAAHLAAVTGFLLVGLALRAYPRPAEITWWVGAAMVGLYYGAETFALHALGPAVPVDRLPALAEAIRMGPVAMTVFGLGLGLLAVSAVLVARDAWPVAVPFAAGVILFLPQFFVAPPLRIAHGVLLGVGCLLLAARGRRPARSVIA